MLEAMSKGGGGGARPPQERASDGRPICRTFKQTQNCTYGDLCRFAHVDQNNQIVGQATTIAPGQAMAVNVNTSPGGMTVMTNVVAPLPG